MPVMYRMVKETKEHFDGTPYFQYFVERRLPNSDTWIYEAGTLSTDRLRTEHCYNTLLSGRPLDYRTILREDTAYE